MRYAYSWYYIVGSGSSSGSVTSAGLVSVGVGVLVVLSKWTANPRPRSKNFFDWSFVVQEIDEFLSHSWHGNQLWKAMLLILVKNGLHACIFGTLAALLMATLVLFHHVPDLPKLTILESDAEEPTSIWCLTTGMLVAIATLLLWRPKQHVFLDSICIDQSSAFTKAEGVLNMGAFLKRSNSMLVLWDSSYVERHGFLQKNTMTR